MGCTVDEAIAALPARRRRRVERRYFELKAEVETFRDADKAITPKQSSADDRSPEE